MPDIRLEALRLLDQMAVEVKEDAWWEPEEPLTPAGKPLTGPAPERRSSSLGQVLPPGAGPVLPGGTPAPLQPLQRVPAGSGRASVSGDFAGWTGATTPSHLGTVRGAACVCVCARGGSAFSRRLQSGKWEATYTLRKAILHVVSPWPVLFPQRTVLQSCVCCPLHSAFGPVPPPGLPPPPHTHTHTYTRPLSSFWLNTHPGTH